MGRLLRSARARLRQLRRALLLDHSAIQFPWFSTSNDPAVASIHALARRVDWKHATHVEARIVLLACSVAWPLVSVIRTCAELRANARYVKQKHGVSVWRQAWQMAYLANRHNCPPASYYKFGLFRESRAARVLDHVHHYEICNILPELNAHKPTQRIGSKNEFHEEATRLQLPVPPVVADFRDGKVQRWHKNTLPECDLAIKAFNLNCGVGFERWSYAGARVWSNGTETLDESAFVERCLRRSRDQGCLIQERVFNHADVEALTGKTLSTVRVVTYRGPDGGVSVLMATIRMPTGDCLVDNFAAGGLAAPVDLRTGTLGQAVAKKLTRGVFTTHPDTGAPIVGTVLPMWPAVLTTAVAAHQHFEWIAFVGWDVAITPNGPVIIEANPTWCVDLVQISHDRPLGQTVFPDVFNWHFRASGTLEANRV